MYIFMFIFLMGEYIAFLHFYLLIHLINITEHFLCVRNPDSHWDTIRNKSDIIVDFIELRDQ